MTELDVLRDMCRNMLKNNQAEGVDFLVMSLQGELLYLREPLIAAYPPIVLNHYLLPALQSSHALTEFKAWEENNEDWVNQVKNTLRSGCSFPIVMAMQTSLVQFNRLSNRGASVD